MSANIFAYADDTVLLALSWHALQVLISTVEKYCATLIVIPRKRFVSFSIPLRSLR